MSKFRVAVVPDFFERDGSMAYPDFDLSSLGRSGIEYATIEAGDTISSDLLIDFDALVLQGQRFSSASIPASGRLALVARFGVGFDKVDIGACTRAGIAVTNTPVAVRRPMAVSILTLLLALAGQLTAKERLARSGADGFARRRQHMGVGLVGRTFASLGFGGIAQETFRLLQPFQMRLMAHARRPNTAVASELGVDLVGLDELFGSADFVSVCCPLSPETYNLVDETRINQLRPSAYLINTARGEIVDQAALFRALRDGRLAGAGLDVLESEPPDPSDPILSLPNVIVTPHALCWSDQCFSAIGASVLQSILDVAQGRAPSNLVDPTIVDSRIWQSRMGLIRHAAAQCSVAE